MKFKQVNAYTWVLDTGRPSHLGRPPSTEETQYREERHTKKRRYNKTEQMRIYQKFCRDVFRERSFITLPEFHRLLKIRFNANFTYYRRRMLHLGLITEKNRVIKPK